jgi:hypothetical protein
MVRPSRYRSQFGGGARYREPVDPTGGPAPEYDFVAAVEQRAAQRRAALADVEVKPSRHRGLNRFVAYSTGTIVLAASAVIATTLWLRDGQPWFEPAPAIETTSIVTTVDEPDVAGAVLESGETPEAMGDADEDAGLADAGSNVIATDPTPTAVIEGADSAADGAEMSVHQDGPPVPDEKPDSG